MHYKGSCHCGSISFEFDADPGPALECNCSICRRKGALLWAIPHESLQLLGWSDETARYTFNNHVIAHRFCSNCGIHPYAEDAKESPARNAYVNLRCVEEIDLASLERMQFDGRSL